jgi:hypothetical protein
MGQAGRRHRLRRVPDGTLHGQVGIEGELTKVRAGMGGGRLIRGVRLTLGSRTDTHDVRRTQQ